MNSFFAFAGEHPFLIWSLAWGIWPVCWLVQAPFQYTFRAYNRYLRSKNIAAQGWPTNKLMDADGDIVHPSKEAQS